MPELGIPRTEFTEAIKNYELKFDSFEHEDLVEIMNKFDAELVGDGGEVIVYKYNLPGQSQKTEKLIALKYAGMDRNEMKSIFYTQRFLSALFPDKFPHFSATFSGPSQNSEAGTIREYVKDGQTLDSLVNAKKITSEEMGNYMNRFEQEVSDVLAPMGIEIILDQFEGNYMLGQDGSVLYVDSPDFILRDNFKSENLESWMVNHQYSSKQIDIAMKAIDRLKELTYEN